MSIFQNGRDHLLARLQTGRVHWIHVFKEGPGGLFIKSNARSFAKGLARGGIFNSRG